MLKRLWQWLKRLLQRWFATPARKSAGENSVVVPRKLLTDTEYETLFLELLAGVNQAWSRGRVKGFLAAKCITEAELLVWLRRFGERLLASNAPNAELAARMVQLGELDIGEVGNVAREIGMQLLRRGEETNRQGAEGAEEEEGEASQLTLAEAWLNLGNQQYEAGDFLGAIAAYDNAIAIKPDFYLAWYNRGNALVNLGLYEQAIAWYDKALAINPDFYQAWDNRGTALDNLGQYEQAIASSDKALAINPDFYQAWFNRGIALHHLGRHEEAIASFDKAIAIKADDYQSWAMRGIVLRNLGQYEEAIASCDKALAIKPDDYRAWSNRGVALNHLGRYEEAIASSDKALAINPDHYQAWSNRGSAAGNSASCDPLLAFLSTIARQNPALNQRGYEGELASYEEGLKHCPQDTHPKGWGCLHWNIGNAHYFQRRSASHPRPYWHKAVNSYNQALKTLTEADFPELYLEVLQDLIRAFLDLGYTGEAQELGRRGTDLLRRLHRECKSPGKKKQLALKFAGFQQLTVDLAVQSGNWCAALELAELDKNACISWLLDGWSDEISSPSYGEIQQLLHPATAIVYWHLSPYALHTFILKHNASSPIVLSSPLPVDAQDFTPLLAAVQRLREFEDWVKDWNQQYNDYRKGKSPENPTPYPFLQAERGDKEEKDWRDNLPTMLENLSNILDIPAIVQAINLTPQPPSLQGKGEISSPPLAPEGLGERSNFLANERLRERSNFLANQGLRETDSPPLAPEGLGERSNFLANEGLESKSKIQNIILVPHRDLHRFPLHALFPDEFTITYLPSAQMGLLNSSTNRDCVMLSEAKRNEASHPRITSPSLLSVEHPTSDGLPLLEFAQVESEAICQIFPNHKRIRSEQVTLEALQSALPQKYSIFHFSGHGTYNFHNPALSYLALAGEDKLTLADIYKQFNLTNQVNLKRYRLVSLAACETAITGNHTITTEYVGLASGFMACGVAHVLSTLWKVESAPSALVMIQFYQRLQQGKPEAVALAEATQWLRNVTNAELAEWYAAEIAKLPADELILRRFLSRHLDKLKKTAEPIQPYNDSYFWAAFTITGMPS
ncbi:protein prenyltransferase, alpha subunit [Scytonema sp. HK-05]|uniref:CHAT domain-containing protein n=1 Tax=Scytonema sp. HK-05 TaxID=1137095 RepID=UPI000937B4EE|nr:CHAT domain-containing tetratricopeptide repeat protein [Scytonema sp. HK-05]OKH56185.1 hypothetical protein NIES2130_25535 [Scytonema sp. HK-05]BAY49356.1 protein prenyltransferase, alpha subunit [Scytonema sp. HK-05]